MLRITLLVLLLTPYIVFADLNDLDNYIKKFNQGNLDEKLEVFSKLYNTLDRNFPDSAFYYIDILQSEGVKENRDDVLAHASYYFANYLLNLSFFDEAEKKLRHAERFFVLESNDTMLAEVFNALGNMNYMQGNLELAEKNYLKSSQSGRSSGIPKYEYFSKINLVRTLYNQERVVEAIELLDRFIDFYQQKQDARNLANGLALKGQFALDSGKVEDAIEYYERSLEYNLSEGSNSLIANGYNNMAIACFYKSDIEKAEQYFKLALKYREYTKNNYFITESLYNLGSLYLLTEDFEKAKEYFQKAYDLSDEVNLKSAKADAIMGLSEVYRELGQHEERANILFEKIELDQEIHRLESSKELNVLRINFENQRELLKTNAQTRENLLEEKVTSLKSNWVLWVWISLGCALIIFISLFIRIKMNYKK